MAQRQTAEAPSGWLELGLYLALILACAVALSPNLADPDLWGHVTYGLDAMQDGLHRTTTYSFTAEGFPWINHEILAELALANTAAILGGGGLLCIKCLLGVMVIALIVRRAQQQGAGVTAICVCALLVAVNMTYHWSARPQVFSYTLFALLIALVSWCFDGWQGHWNLPWLSQLARNEAPTRPAFQSKRLRCLWFVPLLFCVWTNTHGAFVAGYCIFACLMACRALEALICQGRAGWGIAAHLTLIVVVAGLATLINPYGFELQRWLLNSLGHPRPEIAEWHPPELLNPLTIPLILITVLLLAALPLSRRPLDFSRLVVISLTLWQSYSHQRHVPFFAILFGFWFIPHVDSLLCRLQRTASAEPVGADLSRPMRRVIASGLILALLLLVVRLYDRLHELRVERDKYPVAAFQFIADQDMRGDIVVTFNWAQYAIAVFGKDSNGQPRLRVGFDGRYRTCYPQEVVDMHFDFVLGDGGEKHRWRSPESPPFDPERVLSYHDPSLVLISRRQIHAVDVMARQTNRWTLLYQDELAQLWGQSSKYANPESRDFLPDVERQISNAAQIGFARWPAFPNFRKTAGQLVNARGRAGSGS